jgi:hypothetical protein
MYETEANNYGIYRVYSQGCPSYTPDELHTLQQVSDAPTFNPETTSTSWWTSFGSSLRVVKENFFAPFQNPTAFRLMSWFYNGSNLKSLGELDRLVDNVILAPDFQAEDLRTFQAKHEAECLDDWVDESDSPFSAQDGWIETPVNISVPADGIKHSSEADAPQYTIPGLFYRRLLEVIKAAFREPAAQYFHLAPFKTFWKPTPDSEPERVISELYTSDAFIDEENKIKSQTCDDTCEPEPVIAAIMLWSDSTHLTSFGNASLWPIYLFLGNQSKYTRGKPSAFAAHHLAYIPKVSTVMLFMSTFIIFEYLTARRRISRLVPHNIWEIGNIRGSDPLSARIDASDLAFTPR